MLATVLLKISQIPKLEMDNSGPKKISLGDFDMIPKTIESISMSKCKIFEIWNIFKEDNILCSSSCTNQLKQWLDKQEKKTSLALFSKEYAQLDDSWE